jgi:hypothetical protein
MRPLGGGATVIEVLARYRGAGPDVSFAEETRRSEGSKRQLAALAHNVVSELLPLIEIAHSGALDRGNMDEYVRSAPPSVG